MATEWIIVALIFAAIFFFGRKQVKEWFKSIGEAKFEYDKAAKGKEKERK